jgi:FkbM family methyltransferase
MTLQESINQIVAFLESNAAEKANAACYKLLSQGVNLPDLLWLKGHALTRLHQAQEACDIYRAAWQKGCASNMFEYAEGDSILQLKDTENSAILIQIMEEMYNDQYRLNKIELPANPVIIDVGAHVGLFSILAQHKFPTSHVFAFEPMANTYAALQDNLIKNDCKNISTEQIGISGQDQILEFYGDEKDSACASAFLSSNKESLTARGMKLETIQTKSLDTIFVENKIEHCHLLKLDCEGAEFDILKNCQCLDLVDQIVIEVHLPTTSSIKTFAQAKEHLLGLMPHSLKKKPNITVCSLVQHTI